MFESQYIMDDQYIGELNYQHLLPSFNTDPHSTQSSYKITNPLRIGSPLDYYSDNQVDNSQDGSIGFERGDSRMKEDTYDSQEENLYCYENLDPDHTLSDYCHPHVKFQPQTKKQPQISKFKPEISISSLPCKCRKTGCKKMYCECLARGQLCSTQCDCCECENSTTNPRIVKAQKQIIKDNKNRMKFRSKRFQHGCTCKKSKCLQNYCECHINGKSCNSGCQCIDCGNKFKKIINQIKPSQDNNTSTGQHIHQFTLGLENSVAFQQLNLMMQ